MRVLMFGWELPPHISGGLGMACAGLLRGMASIDALEVTFVVPAVHGGEGLDHVELLGLEHPSRPAPAPPPPGKAGSYSLGIMREVRAYAEKAARLLGDGAAFDIIHAHDWLTFDAAIALKQCSGKQLVVHVHSTEFDRAGANCDRGILAIERRGMDSADKIIAVSNYTKDILIDQYRQDPAKIEVVGNAVEISGLGRAPTVKDNGEQVVTFLGRITRQKGPEYFVDAAYEISQRADHVRFVMAGDGDLLPLMKSLVKSMGLTQRFTFPGFLDAEGVATVLARSDVFIMPSVSEPFGIAALEAINAGVPVLLSRDCGLADLLSNVIKVDPADAGHIAEASLRLLRDRPYARQLALAARSELEQFSWTASAQRLYGVYRRMLERTPAPAAVPV